VQEVGGSMLDAVLFAGLPQGVFQFVNLADNPVESYQQPVLSIWPFV
jgi:hypothetical protein